MFRPSFSITASVAKRLKFHNIFLKKEKLHAPVKYNHTYSKISSSSVDFIVSPTMTKIDTSSRCSRSSCGFADTLMEQQRQRLVQAFGIIDTNKDGKISKEELRAVWENIGQRDLDEEIPAMVQEADVDGDGKIDLEEFMSPNGKLGLEDQEQYSEEVHHAFLMADMNHDGLISADELHKMLKELRMRKVVKAESCAMLRYVHSGDDGPINYEELEISSVMISRIFA